MTNRALLFVLLACSLLALAACNEDPEVDLTKDTLGDPLGDIVALDGHLFATNDDRSGNGGSQVDLFKFATDGFAVDRFDLGINHVGYLAAATDGDFVYLQTRDNGQLFRVSAVGEMDWTRVDPFAGSDQRASGMAYSADVDSFVVIYRQPGTASYTTLNYGPGFEGESSEPVQHYWPQFATDPGVIAAAWSPGWLWKLGFDENGNTLILGHDGGGNTYSIVIQDVQASGISVVDDQLWVSYPDRSFEAIALP